MDLIKLTSSETDKTIYVNIDMIVSFGPHDHGGSFISLVDAAWMHAKECVEEVHALIAQEQMMPIPIPYQPYPWPYPFIPQPAYPTCKAETSSKATSVDPKQLNLNLDMDGSPSRDRRS